MKEEYTIGKLAKESGVTVETVRFYEQKGLIKQPSSKSGYRKYPYDDIIKIKFIIYEYRYLFQDHFRNNQNYFLSLYF